ncbi:hypothetical protein T440DRAFT_309681 [Plenodomus tracheiphilus IPT5]|uniref:Uncharacterized protein n=1 Tax=Plenodomus tracheiphilus IPT5 TaxID=1408161 RepID=A0A6A7BE48_9PLEO|nr:hypothetical protein T440DRAFT_309681 [Plenodomus tracheiphilus IPT5]
MGALRGAMAMARSPNGPRRPVSEAARWAPIYETLGEVTPLWCVAVVAQHRERNGWPNARRACRGTAVGARQLFAAPNCLFTAPAPAPAPCSSRCWRPCAPEHRAIRPGHNLGTLPQDSVKPSARPCALVITVSDDYRTTRLPPRHLSSHTWLRRRSSTHLEQDPACLPFTQKRRDRQAYIPSATLAAPSPAFGP